MATFSCRSYRRTARRCTLKATLIKRRYGRFKRIILPSTQPVLSRKSGRNRLVSLRLNINLFRGGTQKKAKLNPVSVASFSQARKLYRHRPFERCLRFRNGFKIRKPLILKSQISTKDINQTSEHLIFNKSDWVQFGLNPREDNSIEEILAALLLSWEASLDSTRFKIVFYRYLKVEENSQWYEIRSYLINVFASLPQNQFPSPSSFLI
jgi:hypothetical protein